MEDQKLKVIEENKNKIRDHRSTMKLYADCHDGSADMTRGWYLSFLRELGLTENDVEDYLKERKGNW